MKKYLLHIVICICSMQLSSQEGTVVAYALPARNSLKFNQYAINPTFSFVREQNKYITFTNKREWVQFDDAPQTYLFSYSGRFKENSGIGVGLFQQNYGVLTTFGGVLNYAYNVTLGRESNLTFGMNLGFYQSGINEGNVITNMPDPTLDNIPKNSLLTVNPGINYGTAFFDFGVSLNNLVLYNLKSSEIIEDNPEQSIQAHVMYTGYMNSGGFFDESKFSTLLRSEFKKDQTVISGIAMLTVPKGIWAQAGYNTLYGVSAGVGLNITTQIALEYNYEKAIGDLSTFGNSHEITLAYKFKNKERYNYSGDDDEEALLSTKRTKRVLASRNTSLKLDAESRKIATEEAKNRIESRKLAALAKSEERKLAQEAKLKTDAETNTKLEEEAKAKVEEAAKVKLEQEEKAKVEEAERMKLEAEKETRLKLEAEAKAEEASRLQKQAAAKAKAQELARLKLQQEEAKAKAEEAKLKLEAEIKAKAEEAEKIRLEAAEAKAREDEDAKNKLEAVAKAKAEEEERIRLEELEGVVISAPTDETTRYINDLTKLTVDTNLAQQELLMKLQEKVASKEQDLKDLKEENDLSEQGIYKAPKAFKSVSAENNAIESLKLEIDDVIKAQNLKITELEKLYEERVKNTRNKKDSTNVNYLKAIETLKSEQLQAIQTKENLFTSLEDIKVATEIERKRRIKRAAYDNEEERYKKDRTALNIIKQNTLVTSEVFKTEDFDFGMEPSNNIQILKDVKNVDKGYYLVIAIQSEVAKRDAFLTKTVAAGQADIDFFFDVNTSKYYIYYNKFNSLDEAKNALEARGSEPYNSKMSIIKIEN